MVAQAQGMGGFLLDEGSAVASCPGSYGLSRAGPVPGLDGDGKYALSPPPTRGPIGETHVYAIFIRYLRKYAEDCL